MWFCVNDQVGHLIRASEELDLIYIRHLLVQVRNIICDGIERRPKGSKWFLFLTSVADCQEELDKLSLTREEVELVRDYIVDGNDIAHKVEACKIKRGIEDVKVEWKRNILYHLFDLT